jgi:hypothetical protein
MAGSDLPERCVPDASVASAKPMVSGLREVADYVSERFGAD